MLLRDNVTVIEIKEKVIISLLQSATSSNKIQCCKIESAEKIEVKSPSLR